MGQGFDRKGLTDRLNALRAGHEPEVSDLELGIAVGRLAGRKPFHPSTVYRWFEGDLIPGLDAMWGLARYFGVNPGWLAFGPPESGEDYEIGPGVPLQAASELVRSRRRSGGDH